MSFDTVIDRYAHGSGKWAELVTRCGVDPSEGLAMSTADSDYPTAPCVIEAARRSIDHGAFGYGGPRAEFFQAIQWWMNERHGWEVDTDWMVDTQGLGHALAICINLFTARGGKVTFFTPVYHEFAIKTRKAGRTPHELPLKREGDTYVIDFEDAQSRLTGDETLLLWCSPQNPSGRVWSADELRAVADFAARNDMVLVSDEVHHDLVYPGAQFVPMDVVAPEHRDRTITLTAASKTFNLAGMRVGTMTIPDATLRKPVKDHLRAFNFDTTTLGREMTMAAYSPEGAAWVDAQVRHLHGNAKAFDAIVNTIPGVHSLPLQSTYLAWVDFAGTGMTHEEIDTRITKEAHIVASPGPSFGAGGETFMRFNLAMPRSQVEDAAHRLVRAFGDLQ